jgi:protoporphyrinogen oxidase
MKVDRRGALGLGAAAIAAGAAGATFALAPAEMPAGSLGGADLARGHRLRQGDFPAPAREERTRIVIAGGGVAGLSAGWALARAGFADFQLLELEDRVGGNARSGRNAVSAYPLGAHYLPVPNRETRAVHALLDEMGVIVGREGGRPVYDPEQLCADLDARILWRGRWHEGLVPTNSLGDDERRELDAFFAEMARCSRAIGADGRPVFAVPMACGSTDPAWTLLDRQSFAAWLDARGWRSEVLRAHVRYAMRDDFGTEPEHVSAWAGLHYFAARRGWGAGDVADKVLTWPEGNARLAAALAAPLDRRIAPARLVHRAGRDGAGHFVDSFDVARGETIRTRADAVILATPLFVTARIWPGLAGATLPDYAPWLVANVTLDRLPGGPGVPLAWDNVSATSASLGYVVATHQAPLGQPPATVVTWYMPLSDMPPSEARRLLVTRPAEDWKRIVVDDLTGMNPELEGAIRGVELWRWGHAMVRPAPGYIWSRRAQFADRPPVFLAHADLSGMSLFEEANHQGVRAAEAAMAHLGHAYESLL